MASATPTTPLSRRRQNAPTHIEMAAMFAAGPLQTPTPPVATDTALLCPPPAKQPSPRATEVAPPRPTGPQAHQSFASQTSTRSPPPNPWAGALFSPSLAVQPEAVDYFHSATQTRQSWRAMQNLGLVAVGRCVLTLGLGGVLEGFVPGHIGEKAPPAPLGNGAEGFGNMAPMPVALYHRALFGLGLSACIVGIGVHALGLARFYNDTASINKKRAQVVCAAATTGASLVTAGGAYYLYGVIHRREAIVWEALPMRTIGNFLVYGAIPNSFSASEITHGDTPLPNRVLLRDLFFALGGAFLMTWAQISTPDPPAPLWAREMAQCAGIVCIAIGGALPRVDGMRAQSQLRTRGRLNSLADYFA